MKNPIAIAAILLALTVFAVTPSQAQSVGSETNLPLPRFVSMKASEANIRRGPSLTHRVDWVFKHQGMPLVVTGEYGHWRRVVDRDGVGGWIHYAMLSGSRTVIVDEDIALMRSKPLESATIRAQAEKGVIARLGDCEATWCEIRAGKAKGWVPMSNLWGFDTDLPQID